MTLLTSPFMLFIFTIAIAATVVVARIDRRKRNMHTIRIDIDLDDQFLKDVMTTMVESGLDALWYWAKSINVDRDDDSNVVNIVVVDLDEAEENANTGNAVDRHTIDSERVGQALQRLLDGSVKVGPRVMGYIREGVASCDAGCIDADAADVIAQVIVHGEIIYG